MGVTGGAAAAAGNLPIAAGNVPTGVLLLGGASTTAAGALFCFVTFGDATDITISGMQTRVCLRSAAWGCHVPNPTDSKAPRDRRMCDLSRLGQGVVLFVRSCKACSDGTPVTTDRVVKTIAKRGLSKEAPCLTPPLLTTLLATPTVGELVEDPGPDPLPPRRAAEAHNDLEFRIHHTKFCNSGQFSSASDQEATLT